MTNETPEGYRTEEDYQNALRSDTPLTTSVLQAAHDRIAELERVQAALCAENARLRESLEECADDLEAELDKKYKYPSGSVHPASQRHYDRDMVTVRKARAVLGDNAPRRTFRADTKCGTAESK